MGIVGGQGQGSSFDALELLANPDLLAERIAQLKSAETAAADRIAAVGPAEEIPELLRQAQLAATQAEAMRSDARRVLDDAHAKYEERMLAAEQSSTVMENAARMRANDIEAAARVARDAADREFSSARERGSRLAAIEKDLQEQKSLLERASTSAGQAEAKAKEATERLEATRARLSEAASRIAEVLGDGGP